MHGHINDYMTCCPQETVKIVL